MTDPPFPVTPFEREMRRRLWQVIGWLDLEASLYHGTECMMQSAWIMSHTLTNVNDSDLGSVTEEQLSVVSSGQSEATLLMIFAYGQCALRSLDLSNFTEPIVTDIHIRQQVVDQFRHTADGLLSGADTENIDFHWFTNRVKEQISGVLQLIALRPLQRGPNFVPADQPSPQILAIAAEILEQRQKLYNDPRSLPWRWIEPLYFPWHALVVAVSEVSVCMDRSVIDRYWPTIEYSYSFFQKQAICGDFDRVLTPMERLMSNARAARALAFAKESPGGIVPHMDVQMSPFEGSVLSGTLPAGLATSSREAQGIFQVQAPDIIAWAPYTGFDESLCQTNTGLPVCAPVYL
jgi:hypothetical protein